MKNLKISSIGFISIIILSIFIFSSCKDNIMSGEKILLRNSFEWTVCDADSTPEDVASGKYDATFKPLERMGANNLKQLVGPYGTYVWLRATFTIPEELKNQILGFYVQYIHFADKVWCNGEYIGSSGEFPPYEKSSMYRAHLYMIPEKILNQDGENTLLLKIWCHGDAEISQNIFIASESNASFRRINSHYYQSLLYLQFNGIFFVAFVIYLVMYLAQKNKKEYVAFMLMSLYTLQFSQILFSADYPFYNFIRNNIAYLLYYKYYACISWYIMFYFMISFIIYFINETQSKTIIIIRSSLIFLQTLVTLCLPTYNSLIKAFPYLLFATLSQLFFSIKPLINAHKRHEKALKYLIIGIAPFTAGILADFILRICFRNSSMPYFTYIGWLAFNLAYSIVLIVRYIRLFRNNQYLTENLQNEVELQTNQIRQSNILLADELRKSKADMEMAAIVQKKLFSSPKKSFIGWDFSVSYDPLAEVSGDMFDFYNIGNILNGLSLFDVSGHGIAASLITMLSKDIINQSFTNNRFYHKSMSQVLEDINTKITTAKGTVENYLTGIICHFGPIEDDNICNAQLSNAGHPYPLLYKALTNEVIELKPADEKEYYGAIGLTGAEVSYQNIDFTMELNDILVIFSDGVTETKDNLRNQFGKENIKNVLYQYHHKNSDRILEELKDRIRKFRGSANREDDITIIILKREDPKDYLEIISDD